MSVYAETGRCAVKIVKHGKVWAVYDLDSVRCARKDRKITGYEFSGCKFKWESHARNTHSYQPYEAKDVTKNPVSLIPHITRMCNHKISYDPFMRRR